MAENEQLLISLTGDKGGVGKSTIAILLAEWIISRGRPVRLIDADPNQTVQTCVDKCAEAGYTMSTPGASTVIVDTAGTSGSSLNRYIRESRMIVVPFQPHVADLETVIGWFESLNPRLQERVVFVPNRLAHTKEQREGIAELENVIKEAGQGRLVPGLSNRPAVYPPLFSARKENFFAIRHDGKAEAELRKMFTALLAGQGI
jgi:MinD-like ATPase involved in chromosome partitioning or flagellar assembly